MLTAEQVKRLTRTPGVVWIPKKAKEDGQVVKVEAGQLNIALLKLRRANVLNGTFGILKQRKNNPGPAAMKRAKAERAERRREQREQRLLGRKRRSNRVKMR